MQSISINEFVDGLCRIQPADGVVYDYLKAHIVDEATLKSYVIFQPEHYIET